MNLIFYYLCRFTKFGKNWPTVQKLYWGTERKMQITRSQKVKFLIEVG